MILGEIIFRRNVRKHIRAVIEALENENRELRRQFSDENGGIEMTSIEYMRLKLERQQANLHRAIAKRATDEEINNIRAKMRYYADACLALARMEQEEKE